MLFRRPVLFLLTVLDDEIALHLFSNFAVSKQFRMFILERI